MHTQNSLCELQSMKTTIIAPNLKSSTLKAEKETLKREISKGSDGDPFDEFPQFVGDTETLEIDIEIRILLQSGTRFSQVLGSLRRDHLGALCYDFLEFVSSEGQVLGPFRCFFRKASSFVPQLHGAHPHPSSSD